MGDAVTDIVALPHELTLLTDAGEIWSGKMPESEDAELDDGLLLWDLGHTGLSSLAKQGVKFSLSREVHGKFNNSECFPTSWPTDDFESQAKTLGMFFTWVFWTSVCCFSKLWSPAYLRHVFATDNVLSTLALPDTVWCSLEVSVNDWWKLSFAIADVGDVRWNIFGGISSCLTVFNLFWDTSVSDPFDMLPSLHCRLGDGITDLDCTACCIGDGGDRFNEKLCLFKCSVFVSNLTVFVSDCQLDLVSFCMVFVSKYGTFAVRKSGGSSKCSSTDGKLNVSLPDCGLLGKMSLELGLADTAASAGFMNSFLSFVWTTSSLMNWTDSLFTSTHMTDATSSSSTSQPDLWSLDVRKAVLESVIISLFHDFLAVSNDRLSKEKDLLTALVPGEGGLHSCRSMTNGLDRRHLSLLLWPAFSFSTFNCFSNSRSWPRKLKFGDIVGRFSLTYL